MAYLDHFSLLIHGMKDGNHTYIFEVDDQFFDYFSNDILKGGRYEVNLELFRRGNLFDLEFDIKGKVQTDCDRCLAPIEIPTSIQSSLKVKYGDPYMSDDEIMYLESDTNVLNVAQVIYEYIILSLPKIMVYDCQSENTPPCNVDVLHRLNMGHKDISTYDHADFNSGFFPKEIFEKLPPGLEEE